MTRKLLGKIVKDAYTGFEGVVVGVTDHLYGCRTVVVEPTRLKEDGSLNKREAFDEQRLEVTRKKPPIEMEAADCQIDLGNMARDMITGFKGVVSAITRWGDGRIDIGIEPVTLKDDGTMRDHGYFPLERVEIIEPDEPEVAEGSTARSGGPQRVGPSLKRPTR